MLPNGAQVVFDYAEPLDAANGEARAWLAQRAARVAALGEPWISFFRPAEMHAELSALGYSEIEDVGSADIARRYLGVETLPAPTTSRGGHILRASTM